MTLLIFEIKLAERCHGATPDVAFALLVTLAAGLIYQHFGLFCFTLISLAYGSAVAVEEIC